jgi:hypothetical protein
MFRTSGQGALMANAATAKSFEIVSTALSCLSAAGVQGIITGGGRSLSGIGDEAKLFNFSSGVDRQYVVVWRQANQVGVVGVDGPRNATRVTANLTELLARRAAARS